MGCGARLRPVATRHFFNSDTWKGYSMAVAEKARWKNWAVSLRQQMMTGLMKEVTKSVDTITTETATSKAASTLRSERFWKACQCGDGPNDFIAKAGFEIEFQQDEDRNVQEVTLRLNETWLAILQKVLDREKA